MLTESATEHAGDPGPELARTLQSSHGPTLTRLLLAAPARALSAVLGNPQIEREQMLLVLRRPDVGSEFLGEVAEHPRWISEYLVKAALVLHPHTPKVLALSLVKFLFWRDLSKAITSFQVLPAVRRLAEVMLRDRLAEISLGERMALARMAPREVIRALRLDRNERIIAALLDNPRLTEEDVQIIVNSTKTPSPILALVARSERWAARYPLRVALARNPRTPMHVTQALIAGLREPDLRGLLETPHVPAGVRGLARRRLAERYGPQG